MKKTEKFTQIYFNEGDPLMEISTWNTNLKHRLGRFAADHPDFCRIVETDGGCMRFLIDKRRCSLRLTAPYSEERKQAASVLAKRHGVHTRVRKGDSADG